MLRRTFKKRGEQVRAHAMAFALKRTRFALVHEQDQSDRHDAAGEAKSDDYQRIQSFISPRLWKQAFCNLSHFLHF
jgi:hypothetical protein